MLLRSARPSLAVPSLLMPAGVEPVLAMVLASASQLPGSLPLGSEFWWELASRSQKALVLGSWLG